MAESAVLRIALAGNPNAGKTSLFNAITGARQQIVNFPGATVEWCEGRRRFAERLLLMADLPGTYGLNAHSEEERVTRSYLFDRPVDVVVAVVDATNLERNLYLVLQLLDLGRPLVVALNQHDLLAARGITIDHQVLAQALGVAVVPTVGRNGSGVAALLEACVAAAGSQPPAAQTLGAALEEAIAAAADTLPAESSALRARALLLLEDDAAQADDGLDAIRNALVADPDEDAAGLIAEARYHHIDTIASTCLQRPAQAAATRSDALDRILIHRLWGLPIFGVAMLVFFNLIFFFGSPLVGWMELLVDRLSLLIESWFAPGSESGTLSLLRDGMLAGSGNVLIFVPHIALLFLGITAMEASGYLARAAFLMDRLMSRLGLHGKSFVPMLLGLGCSVPAVLGTRILEHRRDRLTTMMAIPFITCAARLPIFILLTASFFPRLQGLVLFAMYAIGLGLAFLAAIVLRRTLLRGAATPFVMELPAYRRPTLRALLTGTWERTWLFITKAGTVILAVSVVLWFLARWPGESPADHALWKEGLAAGRQTLAQRMAIRLPESDPQQLVAVADILGDWRLATGRAAPTHPERPRYDAEALAAIAAVAGEDQRLRGFAEAVLAIIRIDDDWQHTVRLRGWNADRWMDIIRNRRRYSRLRAWLIKQWPGYKAWQRAFAAHAAKRQQLIASVAEGRLAQVFVENGGAWFAYDSHASLLHNQRATRRLHGSFSGSIGRAFEPAVALFGVDWRMGTALVGAFAAKEVFVTQAGIVANVGSGEAGSAPLRDFLQRQYSPLAGFSLMLFLLVCTPCMATFAVVKRESGTWRWPLLQLGGMTLLAWLLAVLVFQSGSLLGWGV